MSVVDMTGRQLGTLIVLRRAENAPGSHRARWLCQCTCGRQVVMRGDVLRQGVQSCGCATGTRGHGECRGGRPSRLYNIWRDMRSRCGSPKNIGYHLYGGRGIRASPEWEAFPNFKLWSESSGYTPELTLDRIDPNGDYSPENCRWVTNREQQRNKRNTGWIEVRGLRLSLPEWAERLGVTKSALYKRRKDPSKLESYILAHWEELRTA